jgi:hypothetical protein
MDIEQAREAEDERISSLLPPQAHNSLKSPMMKYVILLPFWMSQVVWWFFPADRGVYILGLTLIMRFKYELNDQVIARATKCPHSLDLLVLGVMQCHCRTFELHTALLP